MSNVQLINPTITVYEDLPDIQVLLAGQLGPSSIAMYRRDIAAFLKFAHEQTLSNLDAQALVAWRDYLALNTQMSPNTINRMLGAVKRVIKEGYQRKLISRDVYLDFREVSGVQVKALKKRLKQHARTRISPTDMRRLCEAPDYTTILGKRDRAMLAAMASSGGRASEIATLTFEQIIPQDQGYFIQVMGKTDEEYRNAHLSVEAYTLIQEWLSVREVSSQYVFTSFAGRGRATTLAISETGVWKVVQKYANQCGLAHLKPHDFRRFLGTRLAKDDIRKAQKALGHKSIETTARHYILDELEAGLTDNLY